MGGLFLAVFSQGRERKREEEKERERIRGRESGGIAESAPILVMWESRLFMKACTPVCLHALASEDPFPALPLVAFEHPADILQLPSARGFSCTHRQ